MESGGGQIFLSALAQLGRHPSQVWSVGCYSSGSGVQWVTLEHGDFLSLQVALGH